MQLGEGFLYTLLLFFLTILFALPLGLLISFGSMSRFLPLSLLSRGLVWIIRGTPLMLQIFAFTTIPGWVFGYGLRTLTALFVAVLLAFVLNYACYFSEIYRSGIQSIPRGQYEAGQVLGLSKGQIFRRIVLLQVIKRIVPPMSNEIITLVKDTSLASTASLSIEMMFIAERLANRYAIVWPFAIAACFYLIFNGLVSFLLGRLEKKLDYFKA